MARKYLPSGLTVTERRSPALRGKLSRCIRAVERSACPASAKRGSRYDYSRCRVNPAAVCRASLRK